MELDERLTIVDYILEGGSFIVINDGEEAKEV